MFPGCVTLSGPVGLLSVLCRSAVSHERSADDPRRRSSLALALLAALRSREDGSRGGLQVLFQEISPS